MKDRKQFIYFNPGKFIQSNYRNMVYCIRDYGMSYYNYLMQAKFNNGVRVRESWEYSFRYCVEMMEHQKHRLHEFLEFMKSATY